MIVWLLLQSTPYDSPYDDAWRNGDAWKGFVDPFLDLLGPVAPAMLALGIAGVLHVLTEGRTDLPAVVAILIGGFLLPFLPQAAQIGAVAAIIFGGAIALYNLWNGGGARPR